jgi:hypothetical protein
MMRLAEIPPVGPQFPVSAQVSHTLMQTAAAPSTRYNRQASWLSGQLMLMAIPAARAYRWHPSENGLDCANGIQGPEPKGRYEIVRVLKVQPLTGEHVSDPPSIRS